MTRSTLSARLDALRPLSVADYDAQRAALPTILSADIRTAIDAAMKQGMPIDEAAAITVTIAADMLRGVYGRSQLVMLAGIVLARAGAPFGEV